MPQAATPYRELWVAGGSLPALVNNGSGETNLTPSWPRYSVSTMQWLRFRESGGTVFFEYASGTTAPGAWTTLATTASPSWLGSVTFRVVAGTNVNATDVAKLDNVSTG